MLPVARDYNVGVLAWSPLASGWLSGAVRAGRAVNTSRSAFMPQRFDTAVAANAAKLEAVERLAVIAEEAGLTMVQLAFGFVTAIAQSPVRSSVRAPTTTSSRRCPRRTLPCRTTCSTPSTASSDRAWTSHPTRRTTPRPP